MGILSIAKKEKSDKPLLQSMLEHVTGRNLDPRRTTYSSEQEHVGKGYHQTIYVERHENLRTGDVVVTRERGNIA